MDKWESITRDHYGREFTDRLRVPGGWLYRTGVEYAVQSGKHFPDRAFVMNTIFVPDQLVTTPEQTR